MTVAGFLVCWFVFYYKTKFAFVVVEEANEFFCSVRPLVRFQTSVSVLHILLGSSL
jgi:hypothetical protein